MRQIKGNIKLGRLKVTFTRTASYFSYISFFMILATFYGTVGWKYASLPVYITGAFTLVIVLMIIDYVVAQPAEIAYLNQQSTIHQNPIYEEVLQIRNKLEELDERNQ